MKRILSTLLFSLFFIGNLFADDVTFVASAPKTVVVDNYFRLEYKVNTTTDVSEPILPDIKGFELLNGPARSQSTSYSNINGKVTHSSTITYTYTFLAKEIGEFTIPGAKITANGKSITSNSVTINVLKESGNGNGNMNNGSDSRSIGENDVFITATASKSKVFKDEALLVTYKLYTLYDVPAINSLKVPQFDNFYSSEAYSPSNAQSDVEYYKGKEYYTTVLAKYLLQPQKSGKLNIEPMSMDVVLEKIVMNQDPYPFLGGFPETIRMNKHLKSNALEINVEALPKDAPASFSGAVGQYALSSELSKKELYTDNEATIKVVLEGTGNLNFVDAPSVSLPVEFDTFPPVVTDEYKLSGDTYKGKKTFEYLFTPKSSGSYTIAPLQFSFFNTKTKKYETLTTDSIKVNVLRGAPKSASTSVAPSVDKVRGKTLAQDIRHIKSDNDETIGNSGFFFASMQYMLCCICPLLLLLLFLLVYRKNVKENANVSLLRTKKANSAAVRRLKVARILMKQGKSHEFYDEVLKAMWGYFSDKLTIPVAELTKDNIQSALYARGVKEESVVKLMSVLDECEFAHYAPGDASDTMDRIYAQAISVIGDMENSIK